MKRSDRKKNKNFTHIGDLMHESLGKYRPMPGKEISLIWNSWEEIVGSKVASNTRPAGLKGNTLLIHATSSPWIHQLQFQKRDILKKINTVLKKGVVKELKCVIGSL